MFSSGVHSYPPVSSSSRFLTERLPRGGEGGGGLGLGGGGKGGLGGGNGLGLGGGGEGEGGGGVGGKGGGFLLVAQQLRHVGFCWA